MRIAFIGSPPFAQDAFLALLRGGGSGKVQPPVALVTAPERRAGRGQRTAHNLLAVEARSAGVTVLRPETARDPAFQAELAALEPDLGLVVSYGQILDSSFLAIPRFGCVNLHASLLPRWRGASPIQSAILAGDRETGVCLQHVVQELDAGNVLARRAMPIPARASSVDLAIALARMGADLLVDWLASIGEGPIPEGEVQDPKEVTVCRKVRRDDAAIDWHAEAEQVDRLVRAMAGWPVAEARLSERHGGHLLKITSGHVVDAERTGAEPGTVVETAGGLDVQCGRGVFRIDQLQRAGKAAMSAERFLRGAGLSRGDPLLGFGQHPPGFLVHF